MCGLKSNAHSGATADGLPFSVNPATVVVAARIESDDDIMPGGMTRKQLREMLTNATPLAEHEKTSAHADRGYSP